MGRLADAFWRAAAYCLHPRVIGLSMLPLLIAGLLVGAFMYFLWGPAVEQARAMLEQWALIEGALRWFDSMGASGFRSAAAPVLVLAVVVPLVIVLAMLLVTLCMTPSIVSLVADRRFPTLEKKRGGSLLQSLAGSLGATVLALGTLLMSMPFWLIPPLVLILPPLIWGWLSYRVFTFDVLAEHASVEERRTLMRAHRLPLLTIGVFSGFLGAAPSLLFSLSLITVVLAPLVFAVTIWLYTLVFAFATTWFAHYALTALHEMRSLPVASPISPPEESPVLVPLDAP